MFHQETSVETIKLQLLELGWEVMSHPPYDPDLSPSDYHLFRSLQNFLNGKSFSNNDVIKSQLAEFVCCQGPEIVLAQDHEVTRKMARGHRTEWKIFD